jgi:hypothetical protein
MNSITEIIEYGRETSLTHFMDQFTIQRLERSIVFEKGCTPRDDKLIKSMEMVIKHLKSIWDIK